MRTKNNNENSPEDLESIGARRVVLRTKMMMPISNSSSVRSDGGFSSTSHSMVAKDAIVATDVHADHDEQLQWQESIFRAPDDRRPYFPSAILVGHILPYLDRNTYESALCINREVYEAAKVSSALPPPWPETTLLKRHDGYGVSCVAFSPQEDGKAIACGCEDGTVYVWHRNNGKRVTLTTDTGSGQEAGIQIQQQGISSIVFSPDERYLVTGSVDATIRVWHLGADLKPTGKSFTLPKVTTREHLNGHSRAARPVHSLCFFPSSDLLVSAGHEHFICLWDISSRQHLGSILHPDKVESIAVAPDGKSIASSTWDGTIRIIQIAVSEGNTSRKLLFAGARGDICEPELKFVGKGLPLTTVRYSLEGKSLHGLKGFRLRKWELSYEKRVGEGGEKYSCMSGQRINRIYSIALSPQAHRVAYAERDGTIRLSTLASAYFKADIKRQLYGHKEECTMEFSPRGKHLLSGSSDGSLRLWTVN